jgi:hypothetical protein
MRSPAHLLGWSWIILLLGTAQEVGGQVARAGCLEPLPKPPSIQASESLGPDYYISGDGHLCKPFSWQGAIDRAPDPGKAFLLSSILPGSGQWYLGQGRWPAYLAMEAWAWIQFLDLRREGHNLQSQYKDLAWLVARRVSTGRRTDGGWEYYESLTKYQASGAFDSDPVLDGIQPEPDPITFNGSIWTLAQEIYLPEDPVNPIDENSDPFQKASQYYQSRAYAPELAWDWGTNTLHQEEYSTLIREADEALRSSTGMVGVILANHLLSAVDALVSGRLNIAGQTEPSLQAMLVPGPFNTRSVGLRIRLPNPLANVR